MEQHANSDSNSTMARHKSRSPSSYALAASLVYVMAFLSAPQLSAQNLPPPSRTMYKCKVHGTTTYSDMPCLGATRLEVEPTRGVSKLSGTERSGADVGRERWHEGFAQALRPISGMDAKQFATAERRIQLPPAAKQECQQLDQSLPTVESEEKHGSQAALPEIQMRLFLMRKRFVDLRC